MNKRADYIIPECYVDTNLVETLACTHGCNHQKGCNQVVKVMREKFPDRFAVGIIDADKRRPSYLNDFKEIASSPHLKLLRHRSRPHFMILVHPAIDGFIMACADVGQISIADFGLPSALKEFTAQTKNVMSNSDARFKKLFRALGHVDEIKLIKKLITYLNTTTYKASDNELVAIFDSREPDMLP